MEHKARTRAMSWLLSLAMLLSLIPGMSIPAFAAEAITLTAETTTWENGDYVVPAGGLTISGHITVNGTVNLTLTEGTTLTANAGITLSDGATLNVSGEGAMTVNGTNNSTASTVAGNGTLVLTSGTLTAKGGNGQGIGDRESNQTGANGGTAINGSVIMNGGTLTATGGNGGSVGGSCYNCKGGNGDAAISGNLTVNGGTMTATNGTAGSLGSRPINSSAGAAGASIGGTLTLGKNVTLYDGLYNVLDDNNSSSREYKGDRTQIMHAVYEVTYAVTQITHTPAAAEGTVSMTYGDSSSTLLPGETSLDDVKGKTVTLNITPGSGYRVKSVTVEKPAEATITLDNTTTGWRDGTYTVPAGGLTYSDAITVSGDVTLVLTDGETLTLNKGIGIAEGATLTIQGEGTMNVNGTNSSTASTVAGCTGTLVLTSGTLTAKGGDGQGFSSFGDNRNGAVGGVAINGNVTVEGGTLTATGGNGGSIGSDAGPDNRGGNGGAAISGSLTINGGTVTTTNGSNGTSSTQSWENSSAGSGGKAVAGTVTDNTGTNTETGGAGNESNPEETAAIIEAEKQTDGSWQFTMPDYSVTLNIEYEEGADKTSLNDAITAAEELYDSIKDNDDYTGIANTLKAAIDTAKNVADNEEADQDAVDTAATNITTAKTTAETAILNALNEIINNAGEGDTITLDCPVVGDITIPTGKKITLDLNGQTITGGVAVENGADLTIKPEGTITGDITNNGTLTVNGGTFNGDVTNNGTLTVNSGTFASGKTVTTTTENGHTTINGGTFKGNVTSTVSGTTTIKGGLFDNMPSATDSGTVVFQGGYYKSEIASGAVTTPYKAQSKTDQTNAESDDNATEAEKAAWANDSYTYRVVCVYTALTVDNAPTISGGHNPPQVGDTLTASTTATDLTYQWYRGDVAIEGATGATYTATAEDVGKTIKVTVTQTKKSDGTTYADNEKPTQTSAAIGPIKKNLADENVTATFTGGGSRPTVTVRYGDPAQTVSTSDLDITYSEPTGTPSIVTVTVTPKDGTNYTGTITKKYTLAPEAKFVFNADFVNFTSETFADTFTQGGVTYEISEKSDFSDPVSGGANLLESNESSKTYYIRVAKKDGEDGYPTSAATQFTITRPNKPAPGIFAVTDTSPSGTNDGGIRLTDTSLAARLEYNIGSEWQDFPSSGVISNLGNGTYQVRYKHDATQGYLSSEAQTLEITTKTVALTGASIKGTAKYGETLTAVLTGTGGEAPTGVTLRWNSSRQQDAVGTGSTYTLASDDIGQIITLTATQETTTKTVFTGIVAKKDGSTTKPTVPASGISKTDTSITVNSPVNGNGKTYEYSKDGGTSWQDSNTFAGLTAETPYFIVVREKAPDEYTNPGASSTPLSVRTDKASVALTAVTLKNLSASDGTTTTVTCGQTLQAVITPSDATGVTYQWYRGETLITGATGSTYTLTGADNGSQIKVVVNATSGSVEPQTTSGTVTKANSPTPSLNENANITKTSSTITVNGFKNNTTKGVKYEYSCDNGATWQESNTFIGLTANTNYQIVVRIAETAERNPAASVAIPVTTSAKPLPFNEGSETPKAVVANYPYGTTTGYPTPSLTVVPTNNATPVYYWSAKSNGSDRTAWTSSKPISVGTYYLWAEIPDDNTYAGYTTIRTAFKVEKADVTEQHIESVSVDPDTLTATITGTIPTGTTLEYALVPSGSSLDGAAWNTVTPPTFKIDRELNTTGYTVYVREKETATSNASRPMASASFAPTKYTVTYNANGGTGDVPATEAYTGTGHAISQTWTGLTRTGYTFGGWSSTETGTTQTTSVSGAATLYAIWTPHTYTVKFDVKDGSAVSDKTGVKYGEEFILPTTTKAGSVLAGWSKSTAATTADYTAGQLVKNLAGKDKTADEITLYAVWTAVASVTGTVSSNEGENVTLKLMRGDTQIGDTQTVALDPTGSGYSGTFRFDRVPHGIYNLVIEQIVPTGNGDETETLTKSIMVTVSGNVTIENDKLKMPTSARSALQVVGTDTPPAVVDGLDKLAESEAVDERSVTVIMTVEKQEEQTVSQTATEEEKTTQEAIDKLKSSADDTASGSNREVKEMDFLNINITKEVTLNGAVESTEAIADTGAANIMEIVFPYVKPGSGKIDLWRFHGEAQKFNDTGSRPSTPADLNFYFLDGMIHLFTRYFSTYAISYTETTSSNSGNNTGNNTGSHSSGSSSSSGTTYAPTISNPSNGTVSINPTSPKYGDKVTITAKPDAGYEVNTVTVTNASGKTVSVTKVNDTTYTFTQPSSKVKIDVTFKETSTTDALAKFSDVNASDWYADAVRWALENNVMNGVGNGKFNPNGDTSRAMVATMLWRMEGSPVVSGDTSFVDVTDGTWFADAVRWANANGIVTGYRDANGRGKVFNNDGAVTREQLATMLYRYAQYKKADVSVGEDTNILSYNDAQTVSGWAASAMQWAVGSGIINGIDGNLVPAGNATRAQVATMLMRYSTAK